MGSTTAHFFLLRRPGARVREESIGARRERRREEHEARGGE